MNAAPIHLAGERLLLDPCGAVFWPARRLLAAADLHLEKGTALAARGQLVPPWDTAATLDKLALAVRRHRPARLLLLGDSFHDRRGAARMAARDIARLRALADGVELTWIAGNHDPEPPTGLSGEATEALALAPLLFRHEAAPGTNPGIGEVSGHFHPRARVATRAGRVARPCFVHDGRRLLLPAFGAYTGGLAVEHPAIAALFPRGGRVFLLGQSRLFSFTLEQGRALERAADQVAEQATEPAS